MQQESLIEFLNKELRSEWEAGSQNSSPPSSDWVDARIKPSANQLILTHKSGREYAFTLKADFS